MPIQEKLLQRRRFVRFTLLSTAVVIGLTLLLPNFIRCRCQSSLTACKANLKNIGTALEMYSSDNGCYPKELSGLTPDYLKTIPKCSTGKPYQASISSGAYQVTCSGGWHGRGGLTGTHSTASHTQVKTAPNSPAYSSSEGLLEDKIFFRIDEMDFRSKEYVEGCKETLAGAISILVLLAFVFGLRRRRRGSECGLRL